MRCVVEGCRPVRSLISLSDTASSREANTSINVNMRSRTWTLGLGEAALSSFFMRRSDFDPVILAAGMAWRHMCRLQTAAMCIRNVAEKGAVAPYQRGS